jgi:hypothetical protein
VAVTCTDEALAQMRLQDNGWNLERAINAHLAQGDAKTTILALPGNTTKSTPKEKRVGFYLSRIPPI